MLDKNPLGGQDRSRMQHLQGNFETFQLQQQKSPRTKQRLIGGNTSAKNLDLCQNYTS